LQIGGEAFEEPMSLFLEQLLNGLGLGITLFIIAGGLTLVFGIMNLLNLAHGSLYMIGAYFCASLLATLKSFPLAVLGAIVLTALVGLLIERLVIRHFYRRDHLDQVLATFGLLVFFNELVRVVWGPVSLFISVPPGLAGHVPIMAGVGYPVYRGLLLVIGAGVALALWWVVARTRFGMLIRAGASQPQVISALGIDTRVLFAAVFVLGAALAALAGALTAPLYAVESGMGDTLLIKCFVVLVIGGLGSVRGAFIAALAVGLADTFGRLLPGIASMPAAFGEVAIYVLMIVVLYFRPSGVFGASVAHGR
jgi:branched-chain amino acid transport system permease protein